MCGYLSSPTTWLFAAATLATAAYADDVVPVGIILEAENSQIQIPGTGTWFTAAPGWELLPGYRLKTASGSIRFAYCPDRVIRTLLSGQELVVPASHLPDVPGLARDSQPAASCDLPAIPAKPLANVRGGGQSISPAPGSTGADLLETISRARNLENAGDRNGAAAQYARLETDYPEAVWTRGVMQRLVSTPRVSAAEGKTFALVIGISEYPPESPLGSLQYADADARAFADFLQKPKGGAIPKDQIRLLLNREGTRDRIDSAMSTFVESAADKQNTLIVFVAAHGDYLVSEKDPDTGQIIEREPYIVTADSNGQDVKTSGFPMAEFRNLIAEQTLRFRRVIVYLDVCHAGYVRDVAASKDLETAVKRVFVAGQGELGVMLASDARGFAYEAEQFGRHGAFTYYVLDGLNGGAARKTDPAISFADLFRYVLNGVGELTNNAQTPDRFATDLQMAVLDDVTREPGISLPKATPLPEAATRRRRGTSALPPGTSAPAPTAVPDRDRRDQTEELRIALEENGQQILVQYLRGEQAQPTRAAFDLCARDFEDALRLAPLSTFDESRMWFCKGRSLIFEKTESGYQQAAQLLERAIRLDPTRAYAYNALGIAYLEQVGQHPDYYARAVDAFRDAIRFAPNWAYPLHNLALADSERGDFTAAIQSYRKAMSLAPAYSYLPYNLGLLNQRMNRLDEAKTMYQLALRTAEDARLSGVSPAAIHWTERARVLNALGTVEAAKRHAEAAQKFYDAALVDDPEFAPASHNLAVLLSRKGRSPRAEQLWRQNIAADPADLASRAALAQYLEKYGTTDDAIRAYTEAIGIAPDYLAARRQLAKLFVTRNQWTEAFEQIDKARAQSPSNPAILEEFADIAVRSNHIAEAVKAWREAASLTGDKRDRKRLETKQKHVVF